MTLIVSFIINVNYANQTAVTLIIKILYRTILFATPAPNRTNQTKHYKVLYLCEI